MFLLFWFLLVFLFCRYQKSRISSITLLNFRRLLLSLGLACNHSLPRKVLLPVGKENILSNALKLIAAAVLEKKMAFTNFSSSEINLTYWNEVQSWIPMAQSLWSRWKAGYIMPTSHSIFIPSSLSRYRNTPIKRWIGQITASFNPHLICLFTYD